MRTLMFLWRSMKFFYLIWILLLSKGTNIPREKVCMNVGPDVNEILSKGP